MSETPCFGDHEVHDSLAWADHLAAARNCAVCPTRKWCGTSPDPHREGTWGGKLYWKGKVIDEPIRTPGRPPKRKKPAPKAVPEPLDILEDAGRIAIDLNVSLGQFTKHPRVPKHLAAEWRTICAELLALGHSSNAIGRLFRRDHTTILYAIKKAS